jgi:hypothetical protein
MAQAQKHIDKNSFVVTEGALMRAIIQAVNHTFLYTEAEGLARFEAPLIAADALRLLLEETGSNRACCKSRNHRRACSASFKSFSKSCFLKHFTFE